MKVDYFSKYSAPLAPKTPLSVSGEILRGGQGSQIRGGGVGALPNVGKMALFAP